MEERGRKKSKHTLIFSASLVVIVLVLGFLVFWPPKAGDDTQGTIGAAKKHRAEQITDKDVRLEGVETGAAADVVAIDDAAVEGLRRTAENLGVTASQFAARGLNAKSPFNKQAAEAFQRTAQGLKELAVYAIANKPKLERSTLLDLSERATAMNAAATEALNSRGPLNQKALDGFNVTAQFISAQAQALQKTPNLLEQRSAYNRAADVNDLKSAATILSATAKELSARSGINAKAPGDLQRTAEALFSSAAALERQPSYSRQAVNELARQAADLGTAAQLGLKDKLDSKAINTLGQKALDLQSNASYFQKNATLERNPSLDRNAAYEREAALERNATIGNKAPSDQ